MGITFAKLFQRLFSKKEMRILMVRVEDVLVFLPRRFCCGFFLFHFFITARISLFRRGRESAATEERGEIFESRFLCVFARAFCSSSASPRLDAKRARGRMRCVYMRAVWTHRSIESILAGKTWKRLCANLVGSFSKRGRRDFFRLKILVHFYEKEETFFESISALTKRSRLFLRNAEHTHRLVSMPPVKPPSYTNLSSEKSWRRFRPSVRFRFSSFASLRRVLFLSFFCLFYFRVTGIDRANEKPQKALVHSFSRLSFDFERPKTTKNREEGDDEGASQKKQQLYFTIFLRSI